MNHNRSYYLGTQTDYPEIKSGSLQARELDIRGRAYELWEADGWPLFNDWAYWFTAEKEFHNMTGDW
jgi:hypothetical protein